MERSRKTAAMDDGESETFKASVYRLPQNRANPASVILDDVTSLHFTSSSH